MQHNAEPEAVDLLMEVFSYSVLINSDFIITTICLLMAMLMHDISSPLKVEDLDLLVEHVDSTNYKRTCLYLTSSSKYVNTFLFCFLPPLYVSFSTCCILFYAVDPVVLIWQDFLGVAEFCTLVLNFN
jgi:hypothetical protein